MSVVIAFGANVLVQMARGGQSLPRAFQIVTAVLFGLIAIIGIASGIGALFGVRRYGRKGLLWPAVTGVGLWLLLFALALPVFFRARKMASSPTAVLLQPAIHSPTATLVQDTTLGFSFDLPEGYEPFPPSAIPQGHSHAFLRQVPNEPNRYLLVKPLGGKLGREKLRPEELPTGRSLSVTSLNWRGLEVEAIRVPEKVGPTDYITFNVQIPMRTQAIQLGFGGPAELESQTRSLAEQVLSTLDGETNW